MLRCANAVLCHAMLCCAVLCCAVLCCAVLCCAVLCCVTLGSAELLSHHPWLKVMLASMLGCGLVSRPSHDVPLYRGRRSCFALHACIDMTERRVEGGDMAPVYWKGFRAGGGRGEKRGTQGSMLASRAKAGTQLLLVYCCTCMLPTLNSLATISVPSSM